MKCNRFSKCTREQQLVFLLCLQASGSKGLKRRRSRTTKITGEQEAYHGVQKFEAHAVMHLARVHGDRSSPETRKNAAATFVGVAISARGGNFAFLVKQAANA